MRKNQNKAGATHRIAGANEVLNAHLSDLRLFRPLLLLFRAARATGASHGDKTADL